MCKRSNIGLELEVASQNAGARGSQIARHANSLFCSIELHGIKGLHKLIIVNAVNATTTMKQVAWAIMVSEIKDRWRVMIVLHKYAGPVDSTNCLNIFYSSKIRQKSWFTGSNPFGIWISIRTINVAASREMHR